MLRSSSSRRLRAIGLLTAVLSLGAAGWAMAQIAPGDGVPTRVYFGTIPLYTDGDYRDALAAFLNESRAGIQTPGQKWIDSICYYTMAGESFYQLGDLSNALKSYNSACELFLAHSNWMMRVQFPTAIAPAAIGVRAAPWGQSRRGTQVGAFPETYMMSQGQINNAAAVFQGGVVQSPVLFAIHAGEIVRCTSLAIRRRRELLGPVSKFDPMTTSLVEALSRHPGPPNHWSEAWVNVQLGCAQAAAGDLSQASTTLQRALAVGTFDHPLTSTALVELGRIALETGDYAAASNYFEEATYTCVNYLNPGVMEEAFRLGFLSHLLLNKKGPYALLGPATAWARANGYRQLQASLLLLAGENAAVLGDTVTAGNMLSAARSVVGRGDLSISQLGARMQHLTALTSYQSGNVGAGDQAIASALGFQKSGSLWAFQIALTDSRYLSGDLSDRVAVALYELLLRDPAATDWAASPLESLSVLTMPHEAAFEHWFEAVIKNSRDQDIALEIADRARRHRFYSTLAMGGRLLSLRWVLEAPPEQIGQRGLLERQDLLVRYPKYAQLAQEAARIRTKLAGKPVVGNDLDARREQQADLAALAEVSDAQEVVLREMAVRREPAEMAFPPLRKTREMQQALPEGHVLMAFFATSHNLYGFLYSHDKYASWKIHSPAMLQRQIANLLREMGNFDASHDVAPAEFAKQNWRATAAKVLNLLLEKSNVDLAGNFDEIAIVPDGITWFLPFEALPVGKADHTKLLISQARVRYAPTVGLAVPYSRVHKPKPVVGIVVGKLHNHEEAGASQEAFEQMSHALEGAVALPRSLPTSSNVYRMLLDELIVLDDIQPADGPYDWSPMSSDRGKSGTPLDHWFALPWGGPEQVMLPGFHTAAETALRKGTAAGNNLFLALCGLMSSGTRTVLISRWRTGGQTSYDLMREFAQELPHVSPAEAWQRAVQVETNTPIEPEHEPRIKKSNGETAEVPSGHPFFWAGYMLVDSGATPEGEEKLLGNPKAPLGDKGKMVPPANAMPANPPAANPPAAPRPMPPQPAFEQPPFENVPMEKPGKKSKSQPRGTKKPSGRQKAAPRDG